jgi:hypothetical protein
MQGGNPCNGMPQGFMTITQGLIFFTACAIKIFTGIRFGSEFLAPKRKLNP